MRSASLAFVPATQTVRWPGPARQRMRQELRSRQLEDDVRKWQREQDDDHLRWRTTLAAGRGGRGAVTLAQLHVDDTRAGPQAAAMLATSTVCSRAG